MADVVTFAGAIDPFRGAK